MVLASTLSLASTFRGACDPPSLFRYMLNYPDYMLTLNISQALKSKCKFHVKRKRNKRCYIFNAVATTVTPAKLSLEV